MIVVVVKWMAVCLCSMLAIVRIVPFCRGHENAWLFILTAIGTVPVNIEITKIILYSDILVSIPVIGPILTAIEVYLVVLAIEEVAVGITGRMLFRKQYIFGKNMKIHS